jgi:NAD(P)-dependent dehydrogenase (short-subunit alcohol dehydrogenase family)
MGDEAAPKEKNERASTSRRVLLGAAATGALGLAGGYLARNPHGPPMAVRVARRFENRVVLVTGATSGIGKAAAMAFAAEGGKVAFCGRRENLGKEVESAIKAAGGEALYVKADVLIEDEVRAFVDRAVDAFGRPHVGFNNAGITLEKPLHEFTADEWDRVVNTNLRGVFLAMKYELPHMIAGGGGTVLVTSSSNAIGTTAKRSAYAASKRGLVALVQAAAFDYAPYGIRVNALLPGTTDTPLVRRVAGMEGAPEAIWRAGADQWAKSNVPALQRMATAEEIASFALALASDEHPYLTGAQIVIDGGKTAHGG